MGGIYHFATASLPSGVMPEQEKSEEISWAAVDQMTGPRV